MSSTDVDMTFGESKGRGRRNPRSAPRRSAPPRETAPESVRQQRVQRRLLEKDKAQVVPVVFGNGTPEKVLVGRLTDSMVSGKETPNLVQAALARSTEVFLKSRAKNQGKSPDKSRGNVKGGKRVSSGASSNRRVVLQHPLVRKLRIVRPNDPGYKRELQQLRNTYAVRVVRESRSSRSPKGPASADRGRGRRYSATPSPASAGPLSKRFSTLKQK